MFGFMKKKNIMLVPMSGEIIDLENVCDPVFAQKMMGDGFAIEPTDGKVYAPFNGEIVSLFPHAYGIKADNGIEVLIHIGIDTVKLNGDGFDVKVEQGSKVKAGDLLVEVDLEKIKSQVPAITTPVIFTNLNNYEFDYKKQKAEALADDIIEIK